MTDVWVVSPWWVNTYYSKLLITPRVFFLNPRSHLTTPHHQIIVNPFIIYSLFLLYTFYLLQCYIVSRIPRIS